MIWENRPYGLAEKAISEAIFPPTHPYHRVPLGEHADLEAVSDEEVRAFFRKHYVPSNAILVVVGDIETPSVRELLKKHFAAIPSPRSKPERPKAPQPVRLATEKRLQMFDRVGLERIYLVWPSPGLFQPGDSELGLLARLLSAKSGPLYRRLVQDTHLAQTIQAYHGLYQQSNELGSVFQLILTATSDHTVRELLPIVDEELSKLKTTTLDTSLFEIAKTEREAEIIYGLMPLSARADRLAILAQFAGKTEWPPDDLAQLRNVSRESLRTIVQSVLTSGRLVLTISPRRTSTGSAVQP